MGHQPQLPNKIKSSALSRRGLYLSHGDIFIRYQWPSSEPYVQVSPHTALRVILELIDWLEVFRVRRSVPIWPLFAPSIPCVPLTGDSNPTNRGRTPTSLLVWVQPPPIRDEQYKGFTYNVITCSLWAP